MNNSKEKLIEATESYLCSLISDVADLPITTNDASTPFLELGIDSFRVLQIIKKLEEDFGTLPKTLLFENFNISDLSNYFAETYTSILTAKFSNTKTVQKNTTGKPKSKEIKKQYISTSVVQTPKKISAPQVLEKNNVVEQKIVLEKKPIIIAESELMEHPKLKDWYLTIFNAYKNESSTSRGTRNIAPLLFIGSDRKGYLNYSKSSKMILVYAYTGPRSYLSTIAEEITQYSVDNDFEITILSDHAIESINNVPFYATPFGVISRIENMKEFSLGGNKMRRLRYQVSKFEKAGVCKTVEYSSGTDQKTDQEIVRLIDEWSAARTMVNPLIHIVREEILNGTLNKEHRLFLTYLDNTLQNAILISKLSDELNGYLMDLEFYPENMPLGGLEYGIVKMMETLSSEGANMLSLGGTYGCKIEDSPNVDPELEKTLNFLRESKIFNDEGNLQFKNKFRPKHQTIFICRPKAISNADNVTDIIMMIADPSKIELQGENQKTYEEVSIKMSVSTDKVIPESKTTENTTIPQKITAVVATEEAHVMIEGNENSKRLAQYGYNPLNIPNEEVLHDLKTDSWAQLHSKAIDAQLNFLYRQVYKTTNITKSLQTVFPFSNIALTSSGRDAEKVFFQSWENKGIVLQNLLFPTAIYSEIQNGFSPKEIPSEAVFNVTSDKLFKGNLHWDQLVSLVEKEHESLSFVAVEISNNAAGGAPMSIEHLKKVKQLLEKYTIPLIMDGTRVLENAMFIIQNEKEFAQKTIWEQAKTIYSFADAVWASLPKDFCVNKGGIVATNDETLFHKIQDAIEDEGVGLDIIDKKLIAASFDNKSIIEKSIHNRMDCVALVHNALHNHGIPVLQPVGSHCILIDVKQIPQFKDFKNAVESFAAWIYVNTGIRGSVHNVGMQINSAINEVLRLAIPVGMETKEATEISQKLIQVFEHMENIPELETQGVPETFGTIGATYQLKQYHNINNNLLGVNDVQMTEENIEASSITSSASETYTSNVTSIESKQKSSNNTNYRQQDIAIVGMSGRYPKAKNLDELWENLIAGKDCVEVIPEERLKQRKNTRFTKKYRGGFLEDVDKFDSMFFNIPPAVAEMFDPQERLLLETAWESIEDAGYYPEILTPENTPKNIGVFVGAVWTMYQMIGAEEKLIGHDTNPNSFLWSVANRISYCLNLSGPSMSVDTACSSSMTALYLACESIYNGECAGAIVGGVNLDLHQSKFDINSFGGALSPDGVCRTFGKGANGYVAGEGVGTIFIKPLAQAEKDGDHIHGVIKSVSVNHGGRTSGYMVPDPKAQANLVDTALKKANIDARSVGYIEAHGTGTELGDPIEISGLKRAFDKYDVANQTVAVGSVKTNIGHLEAAAGVVGIHKVLLQMKYKKLVPSLHSTELNEFIDFKNSPFYVEQVVEDWKPKVIDGIAYPLRAGVSSFGAGGANAHVIIESYDTKETSEPAETNYQIFPLSAVKKDRLKETAARLLVFLKEDANKQTSLQNIGHTLRIGRKSFEHRLIIIASTREELIEKLTLFIDDKKDQNILTGVVERVGNIAKLLNKSEKKAFIELIAESGDLHKVAQLWIEGIINDWQALASESDGKRVSLPTYPFADKRHWVERTDNEAIIATSSLAHPMIDANESTFERQVFKKTFHDQEFFIYDHLVSDIPTLPGVAYLDFARKAGELAAGRKVKAIKNIIWLNPITVNNSQPTDVWIELLPQADQIVKFEVFSKNEAGEKQLHSQGKLTYVTDEDEISTEFIDVKGIQERCTKVADGVQAYPEFKKLGLGLGPSFQVLQEIYKNEDEMLGIMKVPKVCENEFKNYLLHPSLLDGTGQTVMAAHLLSESEESSEGLFVPYSFGEVEILHPLTENCYSYIQKVDEPNSNLSKANLIITDENGKILVKINDSVGIPLTDIHEKPAEAPNTLQTEEVDEFSDLYYTHTWEASSELKSISEFNMSKSVVLFDTDQQLFESFKATTKVPVILVQQGKTFYKVSENIFTVNPENKEDFTKLFTTLQSQKIELDTIGFSWSKEQFKEDEKSLKNSLSTGVFAFLHMCQALMQLKSDANISIAYMYNGAEKEAQPQNAAINGFIKSLHLEQSNIRCKTIELYEQNNLAQILIAELQEDTIEDLAVRYTTGQRQVRKLQNIAYWREQNTPKNTQGLKEKGVYIITGGAGGLGFIFAEFLAKECKARLVLTGRSKLSEEKSIKIETLEKLGVEVLYIASDISKIKDVEKVIKETKKKFGDIDGIIHSAGVLRDSNIRNKTIEEMQAVFAPKIYGAYYLDMLTKDMQLDFFVTFSSMAAVGGNMGQSDYSFANHFMDTYIQRREIMQQQGLRTGKSLSLNWSIWADGGMKLDAQMEAFFKNSLGIRPLKSEIGIGTFTSGLFAEETQVVVVEGMQERMEIAWGIRKKEAAIQTQVESPTSTNTASEETSGEVASLVRKELIQIAMDFLKLEEDDVSVDKILLDIGFDSIGLASYANALNEKYGLDSITPVLFFEYPSINEITKYLVTEHNTAVVNTYNLAGGSSVSAQATPQAKTTPVTETKTETPSFTGINKGWNVNASVAQTTHTTAQKLGISADSRFVDCPIAIVGIGGVMPKSKNMQEYWENLKNEENMISVIPRDRWIWEDYDGDPITEKNKTNSKYGGFIDDADKFDPLFFGISPREAEMMDPQQRVFLETVWNTIEDSGYKVSDLSGTKTGLFVGVAVHDYSDLMNGLNVELDGYTASGNSHCMLANRISFLLNLRGPSAPIDTACSSSLIAIHRAIESIHTGSSDMAIVGGVQLMMTPAAHISFGMAGMLSTDGKCKTFDKSANGYVRGEGSGAIFLKPLAQAEADNDQIYAVIKATSENHGGKATMLTAPNPHAQAELLVEAYEKGQIDPATVGYIECHGTGTSLGDPIEIRALAKSFQELYAKHNKAIPETPHIGLSSVKTNIGHLETAAGISSFLKAVLAMKHKQIPASLHFEELNPHISFAGTPFYVVDKTTPWKRLVGADGKEAPRRAGISSFGFGGANAHVVIEEYIPKKEEKTVDFKKPFLFVLSAKNEDRLKAYADSMLKFVENNEVSLLDLTYTLQIGRDEMKQRLGLAINTVDELKQLLQEYINGEVVENVYTGKVNKKNKEIVLPNSSDIASYISEYNHEALLKTWVVGAAIDWNEIYGSNKPKRANIPTYPFARESYWFDYDESNAGSNATAKVMHPLLHTNTSVLKQQAYSSTFHKNEFFLLDGENNSEKILSVGAFLEMVNTAVTHAATAKLDFKALEFNNLQWYNSFVTADENTITLALREENINTIAFEAYSKENDQEGVHFEGTVALDVMTKSQQIDIQVLQKQLEAAENTVAEYFSTFSQKGLNGYAAPIIQNIYAGHKQLLLKVVLSDDLKKDAATYVIHPAMVQVALQASGYIIEHDFYTEKVPQPVNLKQLRVLSPCEDEMFIWIRHVRMNKHNEEEIALDIYLLNTQGHICVSFKSLVFINEEYKLYNTSESLEFEQYLESFYNITSNGSSKKSADDVAEEFKKLLGKDFGKLS